MLEQFKIIFNTDIVHDNNTSLFVYKFSRNSLNRISVWGAGASSLNPREKCYSPFLV